jgi:hypothetical protein
MAISPICRHIGKAPQANAETKASPKSLQSQHTKLSHFSNNLDFGKENL